MSHVKPLRNLVFSCVFPIVGCALYGVAVFRAGGNWIELFPIPIVLLVVALGFRHAKRTNTADSVSRYVQGNVTVGAILTLGAVAMHWIVDLLRT